MREVAGRGHLRGYATIGCRAVTGQAPLTVSELGQLGVWCRQPLLPRTEINEHGDAVLDTDDTAQAVPVVRHSVLHGELLDRRSGGDLRGAVCGTRLIALPGGRRHQRRGTADEAGEQGVRPV